MEEPLGELGTSSTVAPQVVEQGIQQGGEQQQGRRAPHLTHQGSPALQPGGVSQGADQRNPQTHWKVLSEKHGESQNQDEKEEPNDGMKRRKSVPLHTDSLLAAALVFSLPIFYMFPNYITEKLR